MYRHNRSALSAWRIVLLAAVALSLAWMWASPARAQDSTVSGELKQWHTVEVNFDGPNACESWSGGADEAQFNPFLHRRLLVTFTNGETTHTVPGFFNADGQGAFVDERVPSAECGTQWAVRFTPDQTGTWSYSASFRAGENIAVDANPAAGVDVDFDGATGSFVVEPSDKSGGDFRGKGILRYVGEHYPRFDNGEYYIKTGSDSPENFMGFADFHNTFDHEIRPVFGPFVHTYQAHLGDYSANPGPLWGANRDQGRGIYGALNYLSGVGVNSVYMINYGIDGGDGGDTWAWSCPNALVPDCNETKLGFDISKLNQWELVYQHMDEVGIQLHFVLTEMENDNALSELQWQLYFREMVARFGHHNALIWNLGEENQLDDATKKQQAAFIRALDPYDHPITVHSLSGQAATYYNGLLGDPNFEATSIQGFTETYNGLVQDLRARSVQAGRPWIIYTDEQPDPIFEDLSNWQDLRNQGLWGSLMGGGGGIQWYIGYQSETFGDVNLDDFRLLGPIYEDATHARNFFENYLIDYPNFQPDNSLVSAAAGDRYAFAKPGLAYGLYFEDAFEEPTLDLTGEAGAFTVGWYSPRTGRYEEADSVNGGGVVSLGAPPFQEQAAFQGDSTTDYALLVSRVVSPDVNADGQVTPADAVYIINRVGSDDTASDLNLDGSIDGADVTQVIEALGQQSEMAP